MVREFNRKRLESIVFIVLSVFVFVLPLFEYSVVQKPELVLQWNGKPFRPIGFNYYPSTHPWTRMWTEWNVTEMARDFQLIKQLGGNSIRTFVHWPLMELAPGVYNMTYVSKLQEFFSLAEAAEVAVILGFFDLGPPTWTNVSHRQEMYVNATLIEYQVNQLKFLIPLLNTSKAAFIWDITNEPRSTTISVDLFGIWVKTMADTIRSLGDTHYITLGGAWDNFEDQRPYAHYLDVVSIHYYCCRHSPHVKSSFATYAKMFLSTGKPVILQEFGVPTYGEETEQMQANYYSWILDACDKLGIAGVVPWTLWDFPTVDWDPVEANLGVLRADGSWKPAAYVFRDWAIGTKTPYLNYEIGGKW